MRPKLTSGCIATLSLLISSWTPAATAAPPSSAPPDELLSACGDNTLAVIRTESDDRYVFCSDKDTTGVIELMRDDGKGRSRLDEFESASDLFYALVPFYTDIPEQLRYRLEYGGGGEKSAPFSLNLVDQSLSAIDESSVQGDGAAAALAACSMPSHNHSMSEFLNDDTFCVVVDGTSAYSNLGSWHAMGASALIIPGQLSPTHAGPHEPWKTWYADEDELGDGRYARARVRSCGGTTRLRSWNKASAVSGSWNKIGDINIPAGWIGTQKWYANTQHSLWMGYDADDFWFRADAGNGASFGSRFYFIKYAWGVNCDLKY